MSELKTPFKIKWVAYDDVYTVEEDESRGEGYFYISWEDGASSYAKETIQRQLDEGLMVVVKDDPACTTGDLNKVISQAELLHKKYKTSVDFLNIVKDIQVERGAEYEQEEGERSFEKIATVFNVYRGKDLLPSDIALILEIMKNVRFYAQDRYHLDSVIDKVSYGSLWAELVTQERA
jgi:hypothetical protein